MKGRPAYIGTSVDLNGTYANSVEVIGATSEPGQYYATVVIDGVELPVKPSEIAFEVPTTVDEADPNSIYAVSRLAEGCDVVIRFRVLKDNAVKIRFVS